LNVPNGRNIFQLAPKIYQTFPFQGPLKLTQIGILGLKIYHLATMEPLATIRHSQDQRVDVMITILGVFLPIFGKKMIFFALKML
jgi:hypothetical protein